MNATTPDSQTAPVVAQTTETLSPEEVARRALLEAQHKAAVESAAHHISHCRDLNDLALLQERLREDY